MNRRGFPAAFSPAACAVEMAGRTWGGSGGRAQTGVSRRRRACGCDPRWPRLAPCPIPPEMRSCRRDHTAVAGCRGGTTPLVPRSSPSPRVHGGIRSGPSASGRCARAGRVKRLASPTTGKASRASRALPYQALPSAATPCPTERCQVIPSRARLKRPQATPPCRQALQEQLRAAITLGASVPTDGSAADGRSSTATTTGADHSDVQAG